MGTQVLLHSAFKTHGHLWRHTVFPRGFRIELLTEQLTSSLFTTRICRVHAATVVGVCPVCFGGVLSLFASYTLEVRLLIAHLAHLLRGIVGMKQRKARSGSAHGGGRLTPPTE